MSFPPSPQQYPALSLYPLNDTFQPKQILLNQRAKIGRQSNAKTVPTDRNGYFDTKVISRQHAEVWAEDGKVREPRSAGPGTCHPTAHTCPPRSGSKTSSLPTAPT